MSNTQSESCLTCGGLIMVPGMTYGYAGKVCYCPEPPGRYRKRASDAVDVQNQSLSEFYTRGFNVGRDVGLQEAITIMSACSYRAGAGLGEDFLRAVEKVRGAMSGVLPQQSVSVSAEEKK